MPPHIFAMGQQAYRSMMVTREDQSLILMGLSGSGKTFNARYLLRYLTTVGQQLEHGPVTSEEGRGGGGGGCVCECYLLRYLTTVGQQLEHGGGGGGVEGGWECVCGVCVCMFELVLSVHL